MCGRYGLYDLKAADFIKENSGYDFKPNYNVAPTQVMPVIVEVAGETVLMPMKWGIHRQIGKGIEKDIINTRADKALGRFWGKTVRDQRCLIPANGFYEWKALGKEKQPYWIYLKDNQILYFAGIYQEDDHGDFTFSIMTTTPNEEMSKIHNRMPVILDREKGKHWLDVKDEGQLEDILMPLPANSLSIIQVSKAVNSPRNNDSTLFQPINPED